MGLGEILAAIVLALIVGAVVYKLYRPGIPYLSEIDARKAKELLEDEGFDPDDLFTEVKLPASEYGRNAEVDMIVLNDNDTILVDFLHVEADVKGRYGDRDWSCRETGGVTHLIENPIRKMQDISDSIEDTFRKRGLSVFTRVLIVFPKGYSIDLEGERPDNVNVINFDKLDSEIRRNRYHFYDQHFRARLKLMEELRKYSRKS